MRLSGVFPNILIEELFPVTLVSYYAFPHDCFIVKDSKTLFVILVGKTEQQKVMSILMSSWVALFYKNPQLILTWKPAQISSCWKPLGTTKETKISITRTLPFNKRSSWVPSIHRLWKSQQRIIIFWAGSVVRNSKYTTSFLS